MSCFSIACTNASMSQSATRAPSMYSTRNRWESLEPSRPKRERTPSRWPLLATKSTCFYRRVTGRQSIRLFTREADPRVELRDFMRKTEARQRNYALAAEKERTDTDAHKPSTGAQNE